MQVLWKHGRGTVSEVVDALPGPRRPAYNTVLTMLRILEEKGYARHEKTGRAFVYLPVLDRDRAQRTAVKRLVSQLFDGSPGSPGAQRAGARAGGRGGDRPPQEAPEGNQVMAVALGSLLT